MYEHYLTAFQNGLTDISLNVDTDNYWNPNADEELNPNHNAAAVTFTFAVRTDSEASLTVHGDGLVTVAFGGTGTTSDELDEYAEQAVTIWRAITDDQETTCRYKLRDNDDRDQQAPEHVINA